MIDPQDMQVSAEWKRVLADPYVRALLDTVSGEWKIALDKAVVDERERCAKVAETYLDAESGTPEGCEIARLIRSNK